MVSVSRGTARPRPFASGLTVPLGLLWRGQTLYVSESGRVQTLTLAGRRRTIVSGLPFGLHQQDAIVAGPDGRLYLGSGSTCDSCKETDPAERRDPLVPPRREPTCASSPAGCATPTGSYSPGEPCTPRSTAGTSSETASRPRWSSGSRHGANFGWPDCWPSYALEAADRRVLRRLAPRRVSRATLVRGRHRLVARRPVRRRVGRVPAPQPRQATGAHLPRSRHDVRDRLRPSARARRRPQRRPVGRRLGPRRDLRDQEAVTYAVRDWLCPLTSFRVATTVYV